MGQVLSILDNDSLFKAAPAIFADKPFIGMSQQYQFVPTIEIVEQMRDNGFFPVMASQSHTRCIAKQGMQRHMIKFRQAGDIEAVKGLEVPEIVLVNSHDGSSLYELMMGIFRFVCGNGMVVQSNDFGSYQVKHNGLIMDLLDTTFKLVSEFPKAFEQIEVMKQVNMSPVKQLQFAERALLLRNAEPDTVIAPSLVIEAKREDDEKDSNGNRDLWTTFNVVQENIIKGGLSATRETVIDGVVKHSKRKTKSIKSIQEDLRINKALWELATTEYSIAA